MNSQYLKDSKHRVASASELITILQRQNLPLCPSDARHMSLLRDVLNSPSAKVIEFLQANPNPKDQKF
jgi:hypothetical protein